MMGDDDVVAHRHVLEDHGLLEGPHHPLAGYDVRRQVRDALAPEQDLTGGGAQKGGDQLEQGGLPRAVGADD